MKPVPQQPPETKPPRWAIGVVLVIFLSYTAALTSQAWTQGLSFDEPAHLAASYAYWLGEDDLRPATTAPLSHLLSGWVPLVHKIPLQRVAPRGTYQSAYNIADKTFRHVEPAVARKMFFTARLPFLIFPLGVLWLVWLWGRDLFGWKTSLLLVPATALEPTLLSHGPLINSDAAAAFGMIWVAYASWLFWNRPSPGRFAHLNVSLTLAILTKFSLLVLVPFVCAVVFFRIGLRQWKKALARVALVGAACYVSLVAGYQFRLHSTHAAAFETLYAEEQFRPAEILFWKSIPLPVPLHFADGLHFLYEQGLHRGQAGYILGRPVDPPEPLYFPLALAVKYPIPLQLLLAASLVALVIRLRQRQAVSGDFFLWAPAALLFGLALNSHMLPGIRYVLPVFALLILAGGFVLRPCVDRLWFRGLAIAGLVWLAVGTARVYPHGLAYFNEWAGGPDSGWRYLSDSNIDWGQDLPELAKYAAQHEGEIIKSAYFGQDYYEYYFRPGQLELLPHPFCRECVKEQVLTPDPGTYAISVNMLLGYYWPPEYRDYFRRFRERQPDAKAGYSIFIYRWDKETASGK